MSIDELRKSSADAYLVPKNEALVRLKRAIDRVARSGRKPTTIRMRPELHEHIGRPIQLFGLDVLVVSDLPAGIDAFISDAPISHPPKKPASPAG